MQGNVIFAKLCYASTFIFLKLACFSLEAILLFRLDGHSYTTEKFLSKIKTDLLEVAQLCAGLNLRVL